jgi:hypothetical protein
VFVVLLVLSASSIYVILVLLADCSIMIALPTLVTLAHSPLCGIHGDLLEMFDDCGLFA